MLDSQIVSVCRYLPLAFALLFLVMGLVRAYRISNSKY